MSECVSLSLTCSLLNLSGGEEESVLVLENRLETDSRLTDSRLTDSRLTDSRLTDSRLALRITFSDDSHLDNQELEECEESTASLALRSLLGSLLGPSVSFASSFLPYAAV